MNALAKDRTAHYCPECGAVVPGRRLFMLCRQCKTYHRSARFGDGPWWALPGVALLALAFAATAASAGPLVVGGVALAYWWVVVGPMGRRRRGNEGPAGPRGPAGPWLVASNDN